VKETSMSGLLLPFYHPMALPTPPPPVNHMARQATMTQMHWTLNKSTKKNRRQRPSQKLRNGIMATGGFDPFDKSKRHLRRCTENPEGPDLMRPLPTTGLALSADLSHARQPRSALGAQYCVVTPMSTPQPPHSASIAPPMYSAPAPTAVHPAPSPAPHPATHTHTISSSYVDEAAPLMALSARAPQMRPLPPQPSLLAAVESTLGSAHVLVS